MMTGTGYYILCELAALAMLEVPFYNSQITVRLEITNFGTEIDSEATKQEQVFPPMALFLNTSASGVCAWANRPTDGAQIKGS